MIDEQIGNTSQMHGIFFENQMKVASKFHGACNFYRPANALVDIEKDHDRELGLDTYVKSVVTNGSFGCADATRFFEIGVPTRWVIGEWEQISPEQKNFHRIHELILIPSIMRILFGEITAQEVFGYHTRIASTPLGPKGDELARAERDLIYDAVEGRHHEVLSIHCKISDDERRVQVVLNLPGLIKLVKDFTEGMPDYQAGNGNTQPHYTLYEKSFCQFLLPIPMLSTARRTGKAKQTLSLVSEMKEGTLFEIEPSVDERAKRARETMRRSPQRQDQRADGIDSDLQETLFGT